MAAWKELLVEWKARRAGRRGVTSSIHRAARDVTGPTGWVVSGSWDKLTEHGDAYVRSFERRIPPSLFVSERDRKRHNMPMPLVERCIEDHAVEQIEDRVASFTTPIRSSVLDDQPGPPRFQ